jgi:tetratricopeptide (TPR) repeat protein
VASAGRFWAERLQLVFPLLILGIGVLEKLVLEPAYMNREPTSQLEYWQRFVDRHPEFPEGRVTLGQFCQDYGDAACAGREYGRAIELSKELIPDVLRRVRTPRTQESADPVEVLRELAQSNPHCVTCSRSLVAALMTTGRREEALERVEALLASGPERWERLGGPVAYTQLLVLAARVNVVNGREDMALELYGQALVRDPEYLDARRQRASLLTRRDPRAALEDLQVVLASNPQDVRGTLTAAIAFLNLGEPERARALLAPLVQAQPGIARARELLEHADSLIAAQPGS